MIATILRVITNSVDKYLKYRRISIQLYKLLHLEKKQKTKWNVKTGLMYTGFLLRHGT